MDKDIHFSIVEKYGKKFLLVVYSSDSWQFILRFFSIRNARKSHKENIAGTAKGCFEEDEQSCSFQ